MQQRSLQFCFTLQRAHKVDFCFKKGRHVRYLIQLQMISVALKLTYLYTYVCRYTLNLPFIQLQKFNFQFFVQTISRINNFRRLQIILKNNFDDDYDQKNLVNESFFHPC